MPNLTPPQLALLRHMADHGLSVIGILGADAQHPNQRIYYTSDGELVYARIPGRGYRIVNSLETRGLIKVISTSGEDPPRLKHLVVTERGRLLISGKTRPKLASQPLDIV